MEALDGVRGLAVIIVLLSHTSGRDQTLHSSLDFLGIGHVGVYLFFVLSGYLLMNNLLIEFKNNGSISLNKYFVRRFFRIAPLYYLVITYVFILQIYSGEINTKYLHINDGLQGYIKHLIFYKGDSVFWTIPTEVFFYLLLPLIFIFSIKFHERWIILMSGLVIFFGIWTLLSISKIVDWIPQPKIIDIKQGSQFLEVFLIGCMAAFLKEKKWFNKTVLSSQGIIIINITAIILLLATLVFVSKSFLFFERSYYELRWFSIVYGIIFSLMVVACQQRGMLNKIFSNKFLIISGLFGFSIYLIHFEVIRIVNFFDIEPQIKFIISMAFIYSLSFFSYRFVEKPFIDLSKGFFNQKSVAFDKI
ncbi:acyltransferase [uncultured Methylophaga sp.]|uniref:acyltransferase family protein n=1 Tax=uncultured Methylophaga sp. TaxID=285271 RepID=UPI00262C0A25|nr:acyltransferase [uncultured Methylophaga sp.]|tara:strand:+ start:407 stop:1489 length:1083 start_codon:yes stop_codon:yes gene_type:complete